MRLKPSRTVKMPWLARFQVPITRMQPALKSFKTKSQVVRGWTCETAFLRAWIYKLLSWTAIDLARIEGSPWVLFVWAVLVIAALSQIRANQQAWGEQAWAKVQGATATALLRVKLLTTSTTLTNPTNEGAITYLNDIFQLSSSDATAGGLEQYRSKSYLHLL